MAAAEALRAIAEALKRFPNLKAILTMPGIPELISDLAKDGYGWSEAQMQARLQDTPYWKNTTDAARNWHALQVTDPATAKQRWDVGWQHIWNLDSQLGTQLTHDQLKWIAALAIPQNWSDDTIRATLLNVRRRDLPGLPQGGDLGAAFTQVKNLANDYGVTVSDGTAFDHAYRLLTGAADAQGVADRYRQYAVSRYGSNKDLVDALNRGVTVKEYADPFIQTAVQELGINPANVKLSDSKWNRFLTDIGSSGQSGMSLQDWTRTIRTDKAYGYNGTVGAADQASQLVSELARQFGATG